MISKGIAKKTWLRQKALEVFYLLNISLIKKKISKSVEVVSRVFLKCQKLFYLHRVKGLYPLWRPEWTFNKTTYWLLKNEFDYFSQKQAPHWPFESNGLAHVVPLVLPEIDNWRNSLNRLLTISYEDTGIILKGGVDDRWQDNIKNQLIIVDYKSQAKNGRLDKKDCFGWSISWSL